jgi:HSP20 family molecular chaperone IbpA
MNHPATLRRAPFPSLGSVLYAPFASPLSANRPSRAWNPAVEIVRDGSDALIRLEAPGLDPSADINIEVSQGRLVVSGEKREQYSDQRNGAGVREVRYGSFRRSFGLPNGVESDSVSALYDAGVLSIRIAGAYSSPEITRIPVTGAATAQAGVCVPGSTSIRRRGRSFG